MTATHPLRPRCRSRRQLPPRRGLRQVRQPEMIFKMMPFPRSTLVRRIAPLRPRGRVCARADVSRCSLGAERGDRRAQCDAGFFAKSRPADPDRGRHARDARQEKGSDFRRQCESDSGRHHHDVQGAGGVLRIRRPRLPPRRRAIRRPRQKRRRSPPPPPVPAAVRRSAGSRPRATWSLPRRIRS